MDLTIGQVYKRTDLHDYFGGQQQGGISTPSAHPAILLFTGGSGERYGYEDGFQEDGTFWYTGEGQVGDMEFVRGNKAIIDTEANGKKIFLFEYTRRAHVRYLGQLSYIDHHHALAPDVNGQSRRVIVFEMALAGEKEPSTASSEPLVNPAELSSKSMSELRGIAMKASPRTATPQQRRTNSYLRSEAVKAYVLKRADGTCEGCGQPAPFENRQRQPYLEPHHIYRLADSGPDHPAYVAAVCPNCHRRIHYGLDGSSYNKRIAQRIERLEHELGHK